MNAILKVFSLAQRSIKAIDGTRKLQRPQFASKGGTWQEDMALQNVQARLRMVTAYLFSHSYYLGCEVKSGFLLVLGSGNVDEALRRVYDQV